MSHLNEGYANNWEYLHDELERADWLVRAQLVRFKAAIPEHQRAHFWHLTDDDLSRILELPFEPLDSDPKSSAENLKDPLEEITRRRANIDARIEETPAETDLRLQRIAEEFDLDQIECDLLLLAALPVLHSRYRRLYGMLQLDASRWQPSVGLLSEMLTHAAESHANRLALFHPSSRLFANRLLVMERDSTAPDSVVGCPVIAPDRVLGFLLGGDALDDCLSGVAGRGATPQPWNAFPLPAGIITRLKMLAELRPGDSARYSTLRLLFSGPDSAMALRVVEAIARDLTGQDRIPHTVAPVLEVNVEEILERGLNWETTLAATCREARLTQALLIFSGTEPLLAEDRPPSQWNSLVASLARLSRPAAIEIGLAGHGRIREADFVHFHLPLPDIDLRKKIWEAELAGADSIKGSERVETIERLAAAFQLTASQVHDAVRWARNLARGREVLLEEITADDLFEACRRQFSRRIVAFAQRIEPRKELRLPDVVLPEPNRRQLLELRNRIRNHHQVLNESGIGERIRMGRGILALFVGGSGTGKTMAAEVLASEQHVDLYKVDLAAIASKWVGETEKHLSRIFTDAENSNGMLFFDEADALFGKRGEVKEARDRWANLEVDYLLQRVEEFSGIVIMATNLRQNIDDAFLRRIHVVVEFPQPDAAARYRIWRRLIPAAPKSTITDAELHGVAIRFEVPGGGIHNVVLDALYRAHGDKPEPLGLRHLIASIAREYQKVQRPITRGEFGEPFYGWVLEDVVAPRPLGEQTATVAAG